jgi:hypothetical protein
MSSDIPNSRHEFPIGTMAMKTHVFLSVTPYGLLEVYQSLGGMCCLPEDGGKMVLRNIGKLLATKTSHNM